MKAAATVGEIAKKYSQPVHRIEYVIRSRGIEPAYRAGNSRVFSDESVARIGSELKRIAEDREAPKW